MINRIRDLETCIRNGYIIQFTQKFCYSVFTFLANRTRAAVAKTVLFELVTILVIFQFGFLLFNTSISLLSPFISRIFPFYFRICSMQIVLKIDCKCANKKVLEIFNIFCIIPLIFSRINIMFD